MSQLRLARDWSSSRKFLLTHSIRVTDLKVEPLSPQCVDEALDLHSAVFDQTLEAGRRLCEYMTESEGRTRLESELRDVEETWKRTTSLQERKRHLVNTTAQVPGVILLIFNS